MSAFTERLILSQDRDSWYGWIVENTRLVWEVGELGSGRAIPIPRGTRTDLASVPRLLWPMFPPHGPWATAAVLHDLLYRMGDVRRAPIEYRIVEEVDRRFVDRQFYEAMLALETPRWRARVMWAAVRVFGFRAWRR